MQLKFFILSLAFVGAVPARGVPAPAVLGSCPPANEQSQRIALRLATEPRYADTRMIAGMPQSAASDVRLLTDPTDAAKCQQMYQYAQNWAVAGGGSLDGTVTVFYQAGTHYLAIVTPLPEPEPPPPPPGYSRVRLGGWVMVHVFSADLSTSTPLAL